MTRWFPALAVLLLASSVPALAADLALKRVVLSSGGVGYFEYEARGRRATRPWPSTCRSTRSTTC